MERWFGRVAVVTGASSGIGAGIFKALAKYPIKVVGLARRKQLVDEIASNCSGQVFTYECDVSNEESVKAAFEWIDKHIGGVDILVNNAGVAYRGSVIDTSPSVLREQLDINVMGLTMCIQETLGIMRKRNVDDGHIINISSVAAHKLSISTLAMYTTSKHGVRLISEAVRQELSDAGSKIKISCISPGRVNTDIFKTPTMLLSDEERKIMLEVEDIVEACIYILGTPPRVQVQDLIIKPVGEKF